MIAPAPRGPLSALLLDTLTGPPPGRGGGPLPAPSAPEYDGTDALADEDLQLALYLCYESHYSGLDGVDPEWEWEPSLIAFRRPLERALDRALRAAVPEPEPVPPPAVPAALARMAAEDPGSGLSAFVRRSATAAQFREFVAHRSVYHLKEADPHSWGIPRLSGRAKAALVEVQADEYGGGRPERMHAELFRTTMRALGVDDRPGAQLDRVPAITLAVNNAMSLFGLHRARLAALLGHLAAFELTSSLPNRDYSAGLRRLGGGPDARRFYDEHVEADAVHEQIAAHDLCGTYASEHPEQVPDLLFGAAACLELERVFGEHLLGRWRSGESSLRPETIATATA
ncbi:iron-containing redox enzyme family protein [Allonocardiopsis opalescens]|uniref:Heme oxygenase-like protein n=1 Tax=Allonocardiopsis opalescens TaxID=1144618 RepID=A0A2T0Q294_9ACTN|nr:iron-containing redox enzyme family protein [Allonocardiopsis opalescens]PRX97798.1 heme oxygenase-like protein [Allonocardiopsis opalescens]